MKREFLHRFAPLGFTWKNYAREWDENKAVAEKGGQQGIRSSLWNPEIVKHDIRRGY